MYDNVWVRLGQQLLRGREDEMRERGREAERRERREEGEGKEREREGPNLHVLQHTQKGRK